MSRSEKVRHEIIDSGSPLSRHSMSSRMIGLILDGERHLGNNDEKARRARERRLRQEIEQELFLKFLPRFQFERSLVRLMEGKGTDTDMYYVWGRIPTYAKRPLEDLLPPDNDCDITAVNLSPIGREKPRTHRLDLSLPSALDDELGRLSEELGVKKTGLTRTLLGVGLELYEAAIKPNGGVYFQEPGEKPQKIRPII